MRRLLSVPLLIAALLTLVLSAPAWAFNPGQFQPNPVGRQTYRTLWAHSGDSCSDIWDAQTPTGSSQLSGSSVLDALDFDISNTADCLHGLEVIEFYRSDAFNGSDYDAAKTLTIAAYRGANLFVDQHQLAVLGFDRWAFDSSGGGTIGLDPCTSWWRPADLIAVGNQLLPANCSGA